MTPNRKNVLVGLVVLTALVGLGWMILKIASSSATLFAHGTHFQLVSDRADGVADGSPVLYLGVNVGRVLSVRRTPNNDGVLIQGLLNEGEQIPVNVEGIIRPQSALGASALINLEPVGAPSGQMIAQGTRVRAHFAGSGLLPPEVGAFFNQVRQQQLLAHLDATVESMRVQLDKAGRLIDSTRDLVGDPKVREDLRGTIASIHQTSDNFRDFSARLQRVSDDTDVAVRQVNATVASSGKRFDEMSHQVNERMQQLAGVLDKMQSIVSKVDRGEGTMGLLINDPKLYQTLVDSARDIDLTFKDMQRLVQQWEQDGFTLKLK
jgi:phospholipid/cholesterol/gamma-HCH transport system substrate-binding protein